MALTRHKHLLPLFRYSNRHASAISDSALVRDTETMENSSVSDPRRMGSGLELSSHTMAKLLLNAQEEERTRIGRELHDGVGQELALLTARLLCASESKTLTREMASELVKLSSDAQNLGNTLRGISHDLHPAKLEYLGLSLAAEGLCRDFSNVYRVEITCTCDNIQRQLDRPVALALYRVLQEALHNVVKHSGTKRAQVQLLISDREVILCITDTGHGFDLNDPNLHFGLGMLSMKERVYSIRGNVLVDSKPGIGTRVEVRVPITTSLAA